MPSGSTAGNPMPARVLVTGSTGFVGRALVRALSARGHAVVGTARTADRPGTMGETRVVIPDIGPDTDWAPALGGVDTVVHLAARVHVRHQRGPESAAAFHRVNVEGTQRLLEGVRKEGVATFVFVSSIGAVASVSDRDLDESAPCCPTTPYGCSKLEAEQIIRRDAGGLRWVVLRPPMLYGTCAPGNFGPLVRVVRAGWPLPFGAVANRRSFMFVANLADAIVRVIEDSRAHGIYHVADARPVSTPDFITTLAHALDVRPRLVAVPPAFLAALGSIGFSDIRDKLIQSLALDTRRFSTGLEWTPPWELPAALAQSVDRREDASNRR